MDNTVEPSIQRLSTSINLCLKGLGEKASNELRQVLLTLARLDQASSRAAKGQVFSSPPSPRRVRLHVFSALGACFTCFSTLTNHANPCVVNPRD